MKEQVREHYARAASSLPLYDGDVPPSLGVGDPVALARLAPGETVLDVGSGPGRAIGVDMTPEMRERAARAAREAGLRNVSALPGDLERLPLADGSVDVVISNCVINLVPDKRRALAEAFRTLRQGGRLAVMDTAFESEPPAAIRDDPAAWCGCVGGALVVSDYEAMLRDVGFVDVRVDVQDASCGEACSSGEAITVSVAVTARKPA